MDEEFIDVKIDVFEHSAQRARLRKALTVSALIEEILKEFDDISADAPGKYALYLKGAERPLTAAATLIQLDIQPQDELVFDYIRQTIRQMLAPRNYAYLRDDSANRVYQIQWQPAIIGRPTNDADHNIMLAVNLQPHPKGQTVSRKHAQITFSEGRYRIEPLAENNPIFVNGRELPFHSRKELKNGDKLLIGRNDLLMTFMTQNLPAAPAPEPVQQPVAARPAPEAPAKPAPPVEDRRNFPGQNVLPAYFVVERASDMNKVGQRLELSVYPTVLGRDLPLLGGESDVSRRHIEINRDQNTGKYTITDLRSTNGVTLEGVRIEPNRAYEIRPGMRIGLGQVILLRLAG